MPQWVRVFEERSKNSTMQLGVYWPPDIVEREEGWRPKAATHRHGKHVFRGIRRDDRHGKPMETMSVDDVDSTKLIKTSENENSDSISRKGS